MDKPSLTIRPEPTGPEEKKQPLLQITLDEYGSVPKVLYKGKEVDRKVEVEFKWNTKEAVTASGLARFSITHGDEASDNMAVKTISYAPLWDYE
ncbi:hypothetical protein MKX82_03995 [Niallia sp. FSL R7-0271]|uniref:hypothetical protein n=1 Tax=Niallia sp. FSL R7-0271 TaxID=2921678 RepID=UPI0030F4CE04